MARASDGRRVGVVRNGFCHVSVSDDRRSSEFLIDSARAQTLADALEKAQPCSVPDSRAQVLGLQVVQGGVAEGDAAPELMPVRLILGRQGDTRTSSPERGLLTGPWELSAEQGVRLAAEIREAVKR